MNYTIVREAKKGLFALRACGKRRERLRSAGTQPRLSRQAGFASGADVAILSILACDQAKKQLFSAA